MNWKIIFAVGVILMSGTIYAKTPDGITPANEGLCDVLQADGITKGLYGLCVAFCEAQDNADADVTVTIKEYEAFLKSAPSGKILLNYNRRKSDSDPEMPCIMVEESCPCWTVEELAAIDGILTDGTVAEVECFSETSFVRMNEHGLLGSGLQERNIVHADQSSGARCIYDYLSGDIHYRTDLSVEEGSLTYEQADACFVALQAHYLEFGSVCR